ncbi:hypothetical protein RUND412_005074 [Rhizina undulata]
MSAINKAMLDSLGPGGHAPGGVSATNIPSIVIHPPVSEDKGKRQLNKANAQQPVFEQRPSVPETADFDEGDDWSINADHGSNDPANPHPHNSKGKNPADGEASTGQKRSQPGEPRRSYFSFIAQEHVSNIEASAEEYGNGHGGYVYWDENDTRELISALVRSRGEGPDVPHVNPVTVMMHTVAPTHLPNVIDANIISFERQEASRKEVSSPSVGHFSNSPKFDVIIVNLENHPPAKTRRTTATEWGNFMHELPIERLVADTALMFLYIGGSTMAMQKGLRLLTEWKLRFLKDVVFCVLPYKKYEKYRERKARAEMEGKVFEEQWDEVKEGWGPNGLVGDTDNSKVLKNCLHHCLVGFAGNATSFPPGHLLRPELIPGSVIVGTKDSKFHILMGMAERLCNSRRRLFVYGTYAEMRPGWITVGRHYETTFNFRKFSDIFYEPDSWIVKQLPEINHFRPAALATRNPIGLTGMRAMDEKHPNAAAEKRWPYIPSTSTMTLQWLRRLERKAACSFKLGPIPVPPRQALYKDERERALAAEAAAKLEEAGDEVDGEMRSFETKPEALVADAAAGGASIVPTRGRNGDLSDNHGFSGRTDRRGRKRNSSTANGDVTAPLELPGRTQNAHPKDSHGFGGRTDRRRRKRNSSTVNGDVTAPLGPPGSMQNAIPPDDQSFGGRIDRHRRSSSVNTDLDIPDVIYNLPDNTGNSGFVNADLQQPVVLYNPQARDSTLTNADLHQPEVIFSRQARGSTVTNADLHQPEGIDSHQARTSTATSADLHQFDFRNNSQRRTTMNSRGLSVPDVIANNLQESSGHSGIVNSHNSRPSDPPASISDVHLAPPPRGNRRARSPRNRNGTTPPQGIRRASSESIPRTLTNATTIPLGTRSRSFGSAAAPTLEQVQVQGGEGSNYSNESPDVNLAPPPRGNRRPHNRRRNMSGSHRRHHPTSPQGNRTAPSESIPGPSNNANVIPLNTLSGSFETTAPPLEQAQEQAMEGSEHTNDAAPTTTNRQRRRRNGANNERGTRRNNRRRGSGGVPGNVEDLDYVEDPENVWVGQTSEGPWTAEELSRMIQIQEEWQQELDRRNGRTEPRR